MPLCLSWLNTSVRTQSQTYNNRAQDISSIQKYKQCKHVRYVNTSERESNRKHGRFVSRFEHLTLRPRLQHYEGFPLKTIPLDHSVSQHLQRVHTRTPELTSTSLVPTRTTHASILACRGCTSYNSSNHTSEHLVITSLNHH